jgi:hypothetical protein
LCESGCKIEPAGQSDQCNPPPPMTCPNGNGLYCGGDGIQGNSSTLYQCTGGVLTVSQVCANGCAVEPAGQSDQCNPPPSQCPDGNGLYCGGDGVQGNANTLYQCSGGVLTVSQVCANGCQVNPPGQSDQCK